MPVKRASTVEGYDFLGNSGPWEQSAPVGGGGWNSGGSYGNQGSQWSSNDGFGSSYQQGYGGGPVRGNMNANTRATPYGGGGGQNTLLCYC